MKALFKSVPVLMLAIAVGCGSPEKRDRDFDTSGSRDADQRAEQRISKQQQLRGEGGGDAASQQESQQSLYDRLGGEKGMTAIVDDFVDRAIADPRVNWERKGIKRGGVLGIGDKSAEWSATPAKMNALQDPKTISTLYEASQAGVKIDLLVRGFCCLRPQMPGLSENIQVISILGRFLEHTRIFYFQNDGNDEYYMGSADWMYRNLDNRVEAIAPVEDPALREQLKEILELGLADHGYAWTLGSDGLWTRRTTPDGRPASGMQEILMARYARKAKKR